MQAAMHSLTHSSALAHARKHARTHAPTCARMLARAEFTATSRKQKTLVTETERVAQTHRETNRKASIHWTRLASSRPLPGNRTGKAAKAHRHISQSNDNAHAASPGNGCCETEKRNLREGETNRRSKIVPHRMTMAAAHGVFYIKASAPVEET